MKIAETELDLLETYLDGELPMSEAEGLWRRLAAQPELAAALDELRADRAVRMNIWEKCEPTDRAVATVSRQINSGISRQRVWETVRRATYYVGAAAACLFIGIRIGATQPSGPASPLPNTNTQNVAMNSTPSSAAALSGAIPVNIMDSNGRVMYMPRFQTVQEATDFARQFNNQPVRAASTTGGDLGQNVVPVSDVQQF